MPDKTHQPILCVAQITCQRCLEGCSSGGEVGEGDNYPLDSCRCGPLDERIFYGQDCQSKFCDFLFSDDNHQSIVIAHCLGSFDGYFLLDDLLNKRVKTPKVIFRGAKILYINIEEFQMNIIDSYNFIGMALGKFSSTFNLSCRKGYFPHKKNTLDNQGKILDFPEASDFNPDSMSAPARAKFYEWYEKEKAKGGKYDLKKEMIAYCIDDVRVLKEGCLQFRQIFMDATKQASTIPEDKGEDPFRHSFTIASLCNRIWRKYFLESRTVGIIPPHGYQKNTHQSVKALEYFDYLEKTTGKTLLHYGKGREEVKAGLKVDCYIEEEDRVIEFFSCAYHSCIKCFPKSHATNPLLGNNKTYGESYMETRMRKRRIESAGHKFEEMWECEWDEMVKNDPSIKDIIGDTEIVKPLNPRDAFFGGRTNATRLYVKATDGKQILHGDFCSLYPFVLSTCRFLIKHAQIISEFESNNISEYFGLIKCKIIPPKNLWHPLLPVRFTDKLLFPLCRTCGQTKQTDTCDHTPEERALIGTWVSVELEKALELGYEIQRLYQVWHFKESKVGLFKEYVQMFLKLKQEASGYPEECDTPEAQGKYRMDFLRKEGVRLDPENIRYNPGLRQVSKAALNNLWGKFAERSNLPNREYVKSPGAFFEKLHDDSIKVHDVRFVNDDLVEMYVSKHDAFVLPKDRCNIVVAAFTTAHARLRLYSEIERLDKNLAYFDTDSLLWLFDPSNPDEYKPKMGRFLGDLTNELPEGDYIEEFVAAGPKNYAYRLAKSGKTVCRVRGFTLNWKNSQSINFDSIKAMVKDHKHEQTIKIVNDDQITRDLNKMKIVNKDLTKQYRMVYDKRILIDDYHTVPYGYVDV